jgi:hypothetical protein
MMELRSSPPRNGRREAAFPFLRSPSEPELQRKRLISDEFPTYLKRIRVNIWEHYP